MAGIYIPGMEMPKRGHTVTLTILGGGEVCVQYYDCKPHLTVPIVYKAFSVPNHGRLIEKQAVYDLIRSMPYIDMNLPVEFMKALYELPTIIQADKEAKL